MKKIILSTYVICSLLLSGATAQQTVRLWDPCAAKPFTFYLHDTQHLQVIIFLSPECPLCKNYSLTLNELCAKYAGRVSFTGIVPGKAYTSAEVKTFTQKYKITFPVYIDSAMKVSTALQAKVTPEAFLMRGAYKVYYYGSIDNWVKDLGMQSARPTLFYLRDAIDAMLLNLPVRIKYNKPVGCFINDY